VGISFVSSQIQWYTPEEFLEEAEEARPAFKLKPIEADVYVEVTSDFKADGEGGFVPSARALNKAVKVGLTGWRNVAGGAAFTSGNVKKLPPAIYMDIAARIIDISSLGEDEIKNS